MIPTIANCFPSNHWEFDDGSPIETSVRIHSIDGGYEYTITASTVHKGRYFNCKRTHFFQTIPEDGIENLVYNLKEELKKKISTTLF